MRRALLTAALGFLGNAGCCIARGSRVSTRSGPRPIEDVEVGDELLSFDEHAGRPVFNRVVAMKTAQREVGRLTLTDGTALELTSDHPLYCPASLAWISAGDWLLGKRVELLQVTVDGSQRVRVEGADPFVRVEQVFDLSMEAPHHNFVASGVLVHNKKFLQPTCDLDESGKTVQRRKYDECNCSDGGTGFAWCDVPPNSAGFCQCTPEQCAVEELLSDGGRHVAGNVHGGVCLCRDGGSGTANCNDGVCDCAK